MFDKIVRFIRELYYEKEGLIPLHEPTFKGNEKKYLEECIDTTFVSSVGKFVDKFEKSISDYTGSRYAVATVNGTAALHISLILAGVKTGDEVITQPLTFVATANAIAYCGAVPIFIDVDKDTMGLSPEKLENWLHLFSTYDHGKKKLINRITQNAISAILPMHTFGHPCRIDQLAEIARKYNIPLIEDCAESLGSTFLNKHTGNFGEVGILSFNGNKTLTTGGGGMIITNNPVMAQTAKHITTTAKLPHKWDFFHDQLGYNYRLPNINAALGCAQLEQMDNFLISKRETADRYRDFFKAIPEITFITEPQSAFSNYWLNAILLSNREERDMFLTYTNENQVMTRPAWKLINQLPMYKSAPCGDLSNARWIEDRLVNLPSSVR